MISNNNNRTGVTGILALFWMEIIIIIIINKVWAVSNKHNAIVELLLDCPDIEVNCQDRMGNTALHAAVEVLVRCQCKAKKENKKVEVVLLLSENAAAVRLEAPLT